MIPSLKYEVSLAPTLTLPNHFAVGGASLGTAQVIAMIALVAHLLGIAREKTTGGVNAPEVTPAPVRGRLAQKSRTIIIAEALTYQAATGGTHPLQCVVNRVVKTTQLAWLGHGFQMAGKVTPINVGKKASAALMDMANPTR